MRIPTMITNGRYTHQKILNIASHQRNENQIPCIILLHIFPELIVKTIASVGKDGAIGSSYAGSGI